MFDIFLYFLKNIKSIFENNGRIYKYNNIRKLGGWIFSNKESNKFDKIILKRGPRICIYFLYFNQEFNNEQCEIWN